MTLNRRAILGATAAFAAAPAAGVAAVRSPSFVATPVAAATARGSVRALWDQVIDLSIRLNAHAYDTATVDRGTGLPGWMYVSGEANELGNRRYDALMAILNTRPESSEDIAIIARAATHGDIQSGPRSFASARLANAAMTLAA